jgi:hypothetical protein
MVLEEFITAVPGTVLNGWISALYGLYDVLLVTDHAEGQKALESTILALVNCIPRYDIGYWSFYDTKGALASPYYHRVHITQLRALELTFPEHAPAFKKARVRFEKQLSSFVCYSRALVMKTVQKLMYPPAAVAVHAPSAYRRGLKN